MENSPLNSKNLLVYRASAGSGKTHQLVFSFLSLVLKADDPRSVRQALAITFTRKASMEMKERILNQLRFMANETQMRKKNHKAETMESDLAKILQCNKEELRKRSFHYLQHMLHRYADTAISTIDSFITQLGRPFYRELRTGIDFEIELDRDLIIEQALDEWMKNLGADNQAVTDLMHFMAQHRNHKEQSWNTRNLLARYSKFLFEDRTYAHLPQLLDRSPESYQRHYDELNRRLQRHHDYTTQVSTELAREARDMGFTTDDFVQKRNGILAHLEKLSRGDEGTLHSGAMDALAEGRVLQAKCRLLMPEAWTQKAISFMQYRSENGGEIELLSALLEMRYATTLMGSMYSHFMEFNRNKLRMPLNFMYFQMADLIRQTHPEYLCDRVGQRFQHILIDEFQDTSLLQWQCLFPLVENAIASGGTALVVGDVKQSIYRWRNGDARLLAYLPKDVSGNKVSLLWEGTFHEISLKTNYRSAKNIIKFNNLFFENIRLHHSKITDPFFKDVEQNMADSLSSDNIMDGRVQIMQLDAEKSRLSLASERVRLCLQALHAQLALEVDGKPLYSPRDIAILVRTNKVGAEIASGLLSAGQAVISPDSLILGQHPQVEKIMAAWRFLQDPLNPLNGEELLIALYPEQYHLGIMPVDLNQFLQEHIPQWNQSLLIKLPLGLQLPEIAHILGCPTRDAYVQRLLDEWALQCASGLGAQELRDWWERSRYKIKLQIQDLGNAVTVLTVHSAKGLQFPVVILPELDRYRKLPVIDYQWLRADQHPSLQTEALHCSEPEPIHLVSTSRLKKGPEHLQEIGLREDQNNDLDYFNLLYVALTRAESSMIILTEKKSSNSGPLSFSKLLREFVNSAHGEAMEYTEHAFMETWTLGSPLDISIEDPNTPVQTEAQHKTLGSVTFPIPTLSPETCLSQNLNWLSQQWSGSVEAGSLFHEFVARLDHEFTVALATEELMRRQDLPLALREKVRDWILEVVQRHELLECRDGSCTVLREMPLLLGDGQFLKPDMVLLRKDGTARVIEFKTGAARESHFEQLNRYLTALHGAGIPAVGEVVYVGEAAA